MKHSEKRPRWWSMRFKYENCYSGFCRHCNWKKPPRAIYRAVNNLAKTMKILLLFAALTALTAGAAETNIFNKLNFGGSVSNFPAVTNTWPTYTPTKKERKRFDALSAEMDEWKARRVTNGTLTLTNRLPPLQSLMIGDSQIFTNIVISNDYRGTIQIETNYYEAGKLFRWLDAIERGYELDEATRTIMRRRTLSRP